MKEFPAEALNSAIQFMDSMIEYVGGTDRVYTVRNTAKSQGTRWRHVEYLDRHGIVLGSFRVESLTVGEGENVRHRLVVIPLGPAALLACPISTFQPITPEPSEPPSNG